MKTALLFPGQASQYVGMGADWFSSMPAARALYDAARDILGFDIGRLSFEGPAEDLVQTKNTQPAIFVHSCVACQAAVASGLDFDVAAGHSLGEYSALVAAGMLSFADGLKAVRYRAQFMQEACEANPGTMAAVLGMDYDAVTGMCRTVSAAGDVVVAANYNGATQIVISGTRSAIEKVSGMAKDAGAKRVIGLSVGGAFHSPLMQPSPARLKPILEELQFNEGARPVILNVTAEPTTDPDFVKARLIDQLTAPVLWYPTMLCLQKMEIARAIEIGPKKVLLGLAKPVLKGTEILSLDTVDDAAAVCAERTPTPA